MNFLARTTWFKKVTNTFVWTHPSHSHEAGELTRPNSLLQLYLSGSHSPQLGDRLFRERKHFEIQV